MVRLDKRITIIGCGFVGGTVADYLESKGVQIFKVDTKLYPETDLETAINRSDGVIICVPTPMNKDGTCDDSIVTSVLEQTGSDKKVLLKSTVTPDLIRNYGRNVVYNPEFLREATAKQDFENSVFQIFGHYHNSQDCLWWSELFNNIFDHHVTSIVTNRETASMIKYVHNAWLGTKVAFFHEIYSNLLPGVDYNTMTESLGLFENIGRSHMKAPNSEGKLGYSGNCFPKDLKALTKVIDHSILEQVIKTNSKLAEK